MDRQVELLHHVLSNIVIWSILFVLISYCRSPTNSHFNETGTIYTDHVSDIEATPAHELPGNTRYESEESNMAAFTPQKKNQHCKSGDSTGSSATDRDEPINVVLNTDVTEVMSDDFIQVCLHLLNSVSRFWF